MLKLKIQIILFHTNSLHIENLDIKILKCWTSFYKVNKYLAKEKLITSHMYANVCKVKVSKGHACRLEAWYWSMPQYSIPHFNTTCGIVCILNVIE